MGFIDRFLLPAAERGEAVRVPAWDTPAEPDRKVRIGDMSARDRLWWHRTFWVPAIDVAGEPEKDAKGNPQFRAQDFWTLALVMLCLRDVETNEKLFTPADIEIALNSPVAIFDKYFAPLVELYDQAWKASGLGPEAVEEAANFTATTASSAESSTSPESGAVPLTSSQTA